MSEEPSVLSEGAGEGGALSLSEVSEGSVEVEVRRASEVAAAEVGTL